MSENDKTKIGSPIPEQGPTVVVAPRSAPHPRPQQNPSVTTIVGLPKGNPTVPSAGAPRPSHEADAAIASPLSQGPVVGWLVVVSGAGRGSAKEIYVGRNSIGRDPQNRIAIDFGDTAISREKAVFLVYDQVDSSFTVTPGEGTNIARHNKAAVHGPQPMAAGDTLTIGQTDLRFVPLCGPDFNWEQE